MTDTNFPYILFTKTSTNLGGKETKLRNFKKLFDMNIVLDKEISNNNFLKNKNYKSKNNFQNKTYKLKSENELLAKYNQKYNVMDFKKMSDRKEDSIINVNTLKNPDSINYNPNYNYIQERMKNTFFGYREKNIDSTSRKKYLLKKLWCSNSNIDQNYYLVDNNKLNDNNNKKL